jgi:hypothetical protein
MKITIEIDEKELNKQVLEIITENAVQDIEKSVYGEGYSRSKHVYVEAIKDAVREAVKKHGEEIVNKAVEYGGNYIGKKGLKKMIDEGAF